MTDSFLESVQSNRLFVSFMEVDVQCSSFPTLIEKVYSVFGKIFYITNVLIQDFLYNVFNSKKQFLRLK